MDDCGSRSKQLEELLCEYKTHLQLDNPENEFTEVHDFGAYNFYQEHNKFKALLNGILSRCKQCKSWNNSKQAVKSFADRQQQMKLLLPLKNYLTECLDKLQSVIRENNLTDTIHHLELITRQVGLKFDVSTTYTECFISSDMFYVEVQLEENGNIVEVKVAHAGESMTCAVLTTILRRRDYKEFLKHMRGLASLYQLSGDPIKKGKVFQALVTLEKDLQKMACSDLHEKSLKESVLRGPVGVVSPRQGGQLMRLTYFANPEELHGDNVPHLDDLQTHARPDFGRSLSISVEQSKPRLLPTSSLFSENRFMPVNESNSEMLPASFVLRLDKPLVVSASVVERIHSILENHMGETFVVNSKACMDCLIIKQWLKERNMEYHSQMAYRKKLPEEEHIYRIAEKDIKGSLLQNNNIGVVITRIPFTHCRNLLEIIQLLRQQLLYNQLLTSVLSCQSAESAGLKEEHSLHFDVGTCGLFTVVVTFQEPLTCSLASVEFQVKQDCSIGVSFKFSPRKAVYYDCAYVSRVVERCLSIPVTMKYVFKKARNVQSNGEYRMPLVDDTMEVSKRSNLITTTTPAANQFLTQSTSAVTLLASMIASTDVPPMATAIPAVLPAPLVSPSPTVPNFLTPSPTRGAFSFGLPSDRSDRQQQQQPPAPPEIIAPVPSPVTKEPARPSIKIKLKKVASSDKYVIETPKRRVKKETASPVTNMATSSSPMTSGVVSVVAEQTPVVSTDMATLVSQYNLATTSHTNVQDQFFQMPSSIAEQPAMMEFASESAPFAPLHDSLGSYPVGGMINPPDTSTVPDVEGIFQTLPGGATVSPGGLDVDNPYGFESGLVDSTFEFDAAMDVGNVTGVSSDAAAFDMGNVYDAASTSSTSAMIGSFDIDSTFDLDTILATGSQSSDVSVSGGISMDWNLGGDNGVP